VTSALVPDGVEWSALGRELRSRGLVLAGGQGRLVGRLFRVGHLGQVSVDDIVSAMDILEAGAVSLGIAVKPGGARAAADAGAAALAPAEATASTQAQGQGAGPVAVAAAARA
jgi:aspartate aminotransferase-like enzyme